MTDGVSKAHYHKTIVNSIYKDLIFHYVRKLLKASPKIYTFLKPNLVNTNFKQTSLLSSQTPLNHFRF